MRFRTIFWLLLLIAVLVLVKWFFIPFNKPSAGPSGAKNEAVPVEVFVASADPFTEELEATGNLLANEEVTIRSEINGRVVSIHFKEGAPVSKGQLLVKLFDGDDQAELRKVRASLRLAKDRIERNRTLMEMQGISKEEFDVLRNEAEVLKAEEDILLARISKTEIRAPFNGVAGLREISEGAIVGAQQKMTSVQNVYPVKLEFSIPETYMGRFGTGDTVFFTVEGSRELQPAVVYALDPLVDESTRSIRIRALCSRRHQSQIPGAFTRVIIPLTASDVIMVPSECIVPVLKGKQLFLIRNGKADTVSIRTGIRNETSIQVLEGLQEGDSVVRTGVLQLKPDSPVKIKNAVK